MIREGRVLDSLVGKPIFGMGYLVTAYEVGAVVATGSSGDTLDVDDGHGFAANDKGIVGTDPTRYFKVGSVASNQVVLYGGQTISVAAGETLVNLGADTGFTSPNYDGSGAVIYADMDYGNIALNSTVQTTTDGRYIYHHKSIPRWELVRSDSSTPFAIYTDTGSPAVAGPVAASSTDNAVVRWDGTTGALLQDSVVLIGDTGAVTGVTSLAATSVAAGSVASTGTVSISSTNTLEFRDPQLAIHSTSDGKLDIDADNIIELGAVVATTTATTRLVSGGKFVLQAANTGFADLDTTPSVLAGNYFFTQNTNTTAITTFDDGTIGQLVIVEVQDAFTDFTNGSGLKLQGATNYTTAGANDSIVFIYNGVSWIELCRSNN